MGSLSISKQSPLAELKSPLLGMKYTLPELKSPKSGLKLQIANVLSEARFLATPNDSIASHNPCSDSINSLGSRGLIFAPTLPNPRKNPLTN
jgi:hypothetical protein